MISDIVSLVRSRLRYRRFGNETLQILESVLVARDVRSLMEMRSILKDLLESEAKCVLEEISEKTAYQKLGIVEFFVRAFALVGDVESCLALKYEALVLRDASSFEDRTLRVSSEEWLDFGKDSLENGFYSVAVKGFDNALECIQCERNVGPEPGTSFVDEHAVNNITNFRDMAMALKASHSVQTQSAEYRGRKHIQVDQNCSSCSTGKRDAASLMFKRGINNRNMRKLYQSRTRS